MATAFTPANWRPLTPGETYDPSMEYMDARYWAGGGGQPSFAPGAIGGALGSLFGGTPRASGGGGGAGGSGGFGGAGYGGPAPSAAWAGGVPPANPWTPGSQGWDAQGNPIGMPDNYGGGFGMPNTPNNMAAGLGFPPGQVPPPTDQNDPSHGGPPPGWAPDPGPGQQFFGGGGPKQYFDKSAQPIDPATGLPMDRMMGQVAPPTDQNDPSHGGPPPGWAPDPGPGQVAPPPSVVTPPISTPPTTAPAFDPWAPGGYFASRGLDANGMFVGGGTQGQSPPGPPGYPMVPAALPPDATGRQPNGGQQGGNVPSVMINQSTNGQPLSNGQAGGQGWSPNPYLTQQAQGILGGVTDNLRNNILPGLRASMRAAGGYGDSRTGIAEGMAMQGANTSASNALANLLGQSYESDMNRGLQRYGIDTGASTSRYNTDVGAGVTMRGQDLNQVLGLGNLNLGQQRLGLDTELGRGQLGLGQQRLGLDTELGRGQLALGGRNADISQQGVNNALMLGLGNLGLGYTNADINRTLGLGGLGIQQQQADTSRIGTMGNLQLGNRNADISQMLGLGNLGVAQQQANTARDLGFGNLGLGYYGADTNRLLGLGQLGLGQQAQDTNRFTAQNNAGIGWGNLALGNRQADNSYNLGLGNLALGNRNTDLAGQRLGYDMFTGGVNNAINWNNALYNMGQANLNAPMGPINQANPFLQALMAATGSGNVTMPGQGGGWSGALGGALTAAQLARMFFGGP